jgi:hypothetical protein
VCPGEVITFTCVTNGTLSHNWTSDVNEYIVDQLEFAAFHLPGEIRSETLLASAQLIAVENRTQGIIRSELRLTVAADFPIPNISCLNVDHGPRLTNSTSFQLLGITSGR